MANYYSNLTVVAARDSLPSKLERFDDVTHLFDPLTSACLVCHSANWLAFSLGKVANAYEFPDLGYLSQISGRLTVLDQSRIDAAIQAIEHLFDRIAANPVFFIDLMGGRCTEAEVADALRSAPKLPEPQHEPDNDSGTEEPLCTIGFLKSHLEVLRIAMRTGSHAIHAQS